MNIMGKEQSKKTNKGKIPITQFIGMTTNNATDKWVVEKYFKKDTELRSVSDWTKQVHKHLKGIEIKVNA